MSVTDQPSWAHPFLRLHYRSVERRVAAAEVAAAELGVELETAMIREALAYEHGQYRRVAFGFVVGASIFVIVMTALNRAVCTPGGLLKPSPTNNCTAVAEA
ncbi:hypothetical protein [Streptomyces sp. NBC_00658]|uniref:hypothetical protein n=1 Tax=Streptomyces sp. NBC_00658 TaxID=2975800 RepID=UPI00324F3C01